MNEQRHFLVVNSHSGKVYLLEADIRQVWLNSPLSLLSISSGPGSSLYVYVFVCLHMFVSQLASLCILFFSICLCRSMTFSWHLLTQLITFYHQSNSSWALRDPVQNTGLSCSLYLIIPTCCLWSHEYETYQSHPRMRPSPLYRHSCGADQTCWYHVWRDVEIICIEHHACSSMVSPLIFIISYSSIHLSILCATGVKQTLSKRALNTRWTSVMTLWLRNLMHVFTHGPTIHVLLPVLMPL